MWTEGTRAADLAFFSGFLAGDGSFVICENNAGASWCCTFQVKLRADDTPLLAAIRDWTGIGQLFTARARNGSRPQTAWVVARRDDCLTLAALLDEFPPAGKAARQFAIWKRAVHEWATEGGASPRLRQFGAELRALHRSAAPVTCPVDMCQDQLLGFLGGFATAEAHFGASGAGHPRFKINVRADDGPLLRCFRDTLAIGYLRPVPAAGTSQAAVSWRIGRLTELRAAVEALDSSPPRGRVAGVYEAWRELVLLERRTGGARAALAAQVKQRHAYRPGQERFEMTTASERSRRRCLNALKSWAETRDSPGSGSDYTLWRREAAPDAPTRNTVAAAFGSWRAALDAAGLSAVRAMPSETIAAIRATCTSRRQARQAELRSLIVAAVRRCAAELGREPRATEFLRWRHQHPRDCPSQMTMYRMFPGGFTEVLAAAGTREAERGPSAR